MSINKIKDNYNNRRAFTTRPDRAIEMGGFAPSATKDGSSIQMASSGTSTDFGDLTNNRTLAGGMTASSVTRALFYGGEVPGANSTDVDSFELASTGNAADFGDLAVARGYSAATSNGTRAISAGGVTPVINNIDFASIAQMGNFTDFGDLTVSRNSLVGICSPVRGVFAGGTDGTSPSPAFKNDIDYITINSTGNATDFGDLTGTSGYMAVTNDSSGKGFFIGGQGSPSTKNSEATDLITIATTGNATEFGTLTQRTKVAASACQGTTGFTLGGANPSYNNVIQRFVMPSLGNMTDFGDLNVSKGDNKGGCGSHDGIDWGSAAVQRPSVNYMPGSGRALFTGGQNPSVSTSIDMTMIKTKGNSSSFGTLATGMRSMSSASSLTRSLSAGGYGSGYEDAIRSVEFASQGNDSDFGNLLAGTYDPQSGVVGNTTRGIFAGGHTSPTQTNVIQYVTIASVGNATDFGDLSGVRQSMAGVTSNTRGVFGGGTSGPADVNTMEYITIASTGNTTDFGDLSAARTEAGGLSSSTRGVFGGGYYPDSKVNIIEYITIASTSNTTDFGDLSVSRDNMATGSDSITGVFAGGAAPSDSNVIDFITIASTGDATDFGDITAARRGLVGTSDSHGGLQA